MRIQIRDLRGGDWYWIHKEVILRFGGRLGPYGIAIYSALALFAHSKTQACYPSQQRIAEIIGCSRRTVFSYLKRLEKLNLVKLERNGPTEHNLYPSEICTTLTSQRTQTCK